MAFSRNKISIFLSVVVSLSLIALLGCNDFFPKQTANVTIRNVHLFGTVVAFNSSSTLLASGDQDGHILLSSLPKGSPVVNIKAHRDYVTGIGFLGEDQFVSTGDDKRIVVWDTTGKMLREIHTPSTITQMVMSIKGRIMITGHEDGSVRLWKLPHLEQGGDYHLHRGKVLSVAYDAENQRFASSGSEGRVMVWKAGLEPRELDKIYGNTASLLFSSDGRTLFGGGWFKLYRWDVASGKVQIFRTEHHGSIHRLSYTGDDNTLATISRHTDSAVYFLNSKNGAAERRFQSHDLCGADIAVSPDGCYLATTSDDSSVRIWYLDCKARKLTESRPAPAAELYDPGSLQSDPYGPPL
jgi:WD40 repeat protein